MCIYDECHRACSDSAKYVLSILGFLEPSKKLLVGFSATPFRNDSKGLGEVFKKIVYHKSVRDLIDLEYFCKPVGIKIKTDLDLSKVNTQDGDFTPHSLASVMDTPQLNDLVVSTVIEQAPNRKIVAFAVIVEHAKNLAEAFRRRGIASEAVSGETPQHERDRLLESFKSGSITVHR